MYYLLKINKEINTYRFLYNGIRNLQNRQGDQSLTRYANVVWPTAWKHTSVIPLKQNEYRFSYNGISL